jgi:phosphonoacetaldehyde hydrolase
MTLRIQAVILDWAGTVLDHGSRAPIGAFVEAFAHFGVSITVADARGPMGMAKRDHIRMLGTRPAVAAAWRAAQGRDFEEDAIDAIFAVFEPLNIAAVEAHATLIRGARQALLWCEARGIRIGSTTGCTRPIMRRLAPLAAAQGFSPEVMVCAGDLAAGRSAPLQMWHAMAAMGVHPASAVLKLDDTPPGIVEARAAGYWAAGVALTGNITGLAEHQLDALSALEREALRRDVADVLPRAGAHAVVDSTADLPRLTERIDAHLAHGERPAVVDAR